MHKDNFIWTRVCSGFSSSNWEQSSY